MLHSVKRHIVTNMPIHTCMHTPAHLWHVQDSDTAASLAQDQLDTRVRQQQRKQRLLQLLQCTGAAV